MPSDAPIRSPRRRMSLQKKLWIGGVGFPTLLLIVLAIYIADRAPTIRLIDWLESTHKSRVTMIFNPSNNTYVKQTKGIVSAELPWPFEGKTTSDPLPPLYKYFGVITRIEAHFGELTREQIETIGNITSLTNLELFGLQGFNENDLRPFEKLRNLQSLHLRNTQFSITDASIEWIVGLEKLEYLYVVGESKVTEAGIKKLEQMKQLKAIYLDSLDQLEHPGVWLRQFQELTCANLNQECSECLHAIAGLKKLHLLNLRSENGFSDESLAMIHNVKSLRMVTIRGYVSPEAVAALQAALPNARIYNLNTNHGSIIPFN